MVKNLIPFSGRTTGSDRVTKLLSFALILGLLQTFTWTYQIINPPRAIAATSYAPSQATALTIPSSVDTFTFTAIGGGAGRNGLDGAGNTSYSPSARGQVGGAFSVVAGDVIGIYPGNAGASGSSGTNTGGGAGGADTYASANYNGGNGANSGSVGSSGGGGGGGAASVLTKNLTVWAVAGGAGGAGGSANWSGSGQDGQSNHLSAGTTNGGNGVQTSTSNAGTGKSCTISTNDGGGGGGGGGGSNGGAGGILTNAGTAECSGLGGYRGNNYLIAGLASSSNTTNTSANTSNGSISIEMNLSIPSSINAVATEQTFTISWATAAAAQSFSIKIYNSTGSTLLQTISVPSGTYSKLVSNSDFSAIASGTTYQVSVTAIGNSGAPYVDSGESTKITVNTRVTSSSSDKYLSLNGSNQEAITLDHPDLDITTNFSGEAWVYPTNSSARGTVFGKWRSYMLQAYNGNWYYWLYGATDWTGVNTGIPVAANEWSHIAFTRAASTNEVKFYLNGVLVYTGTADSVGTGTINNFSANFTIGSHNSTSDFFAGRIDEVKIWNVVRSQSEIQSDLRTYGGSTSAGLMAYYDFNELSGNVLFNRTTNGSALLDLQTVNSPSIATVASTTTNQAYTVITFPRNYLVSNGGWRIPSNVSSIKSLVVGGGGAGGSRAGGGGGAGGYVFDGSLIVNKNETYSVVVGTGGFGSANSAGANGTNSSLGSLRVAIGGGGGGHAGGLNNSTRNGKDGGSGGGAGGDCCTTNASATVGATTQNSTYSYGVGFQGGAGINGGSGAWASGGGGGSRSAGSAAIIGTAGKGGGGIVDPIGGTSICYATGGGGGVNVGFNAGSGGDCGGATSPNSNSGRASNVSPTAALTNTGSGGGGAGYNGNNADVAGGNGASGVVVIAYITDTPTIITQPLSDTTTAGIVETFTITTSVAPTPLTKSVQWQFTADTTTGISGWTNVSTGTGFTTDTFTTLALTKSMNKYRYRAIVSFSDTGTLTVQETSTVAILTINDSITISSDTSTITRKYGEAQTVRTIAYSGGTTNTGAVGTSTSHTVSRPFISSSSGKITLDTSTSTARLIIDTRTAVGTYFETITVTDSKGASSSYTQRVVVTAADTLTITSGTPPTLTYNGAQAIFNETITVTGLVNGDQVSGVTYNYSASAATCANGGLCSVGDIGPSGGYVFYVSPTVINVAAGISTGGIYLEAAPVSQQGTAEFGCTGTNTPGTSYAVGSGAANTLAIINACATAGIAARVTSNLTFAGYSDWFMPSLDEMTAIYNNLYRNTPSLGGFTGLDYGSSSQGTNGNGYQAYWWFGNGAVSGQTNKNLAVAYRPVRAFNPTYTSSVNYGPSTTKPTGAGTYTITPSVLTFSDGALSNYIFVKYETSTLTINKAQQDTLTITSKLAPYNGGTSTMKLTTAGGTDTGTVTYAIVSGGTASGCLISSNELSYTSAGTCKVVATKAATLNYLITYSDTVTITLSAFVSNQQVQTQSVPTQLPINGANSLETSTVTAALLTITGVTNSGGGAYTIAGTGFTNVSVVRIGGTDLVLNTNYTVTSTTAISITNASGLVGPLFIYLSDGQQAVRFEFPS